MYMFVSTIFIAYKKHRRMRSIVIAVLIISGVIFAGSVMLMSPKGGLGVAIGGVGGSNEYGSKKSLENTLKQSALWSVIIFVLASLILPYMS
jgi:protein translocase SecG subunit